MHQEPLCLLVAASDFSLLQQKLAMFNVLFLQSKLCSPLTQACSPALPRSQGLQRLMALSLVCLHSVQPNQTLRLGPPAWRMVRRSGCKL